jgi:hypothetical protein
MRVAALSLAFLGLASASRLHRMLDRFTPGEPESSEIADLPPSYHERNEKALTDQPTPDNAHWARNQPSSIGRTGIHDYYGTDEVQGEQDVEGAKEMSQIHKWDKQTYPPPDNINYARNHKTGIARTGIHDYDNAAFSPGKEKEEPTVASLFQMESKVKVSEPGVEDVELPASYRERNEKAQEQFPTPDNVHWARNSKSSIGRTGIHDYYGTEARTNNPEDIAAAKEAHQIKMWDEYTYPVPDNIHDARVKGVGLGRTGIHDYYDGGLETFHPHEMVKAPRNDNRF